MYTESNLAPRLVMLGTADEVLDYRVAEAAFPAQEVSIVEGGSHAGYDFLDAFLQAAWLTIKQADFFGSKWRLSLGCFPFRSHCDSWKDVHGYV